MKIKKVFFLLKGYLYLSLSGYCLFYFTLSFSSPCLSSNMNSLFDRDKSLMYHTKTLTCYICQKHTSANNNISLQKKKKHTLSIKSIGGQIKKLLYSKHRKVIYEHDHMGVFPSNTTRTRFQMIISIVLNWLGQNTGCTTQQTQL